jgi:transcriptional regulator with XRE-family HTH domain
METRHDWSLRVAARVGEQVAYYRTHQAVFTTKDDDWTSDKGPPGQRVKPPMTLQELSDRCTGLGYPIARSVLSKLEKGHRHSVSVDEVLVLAAALHVPPALLLFPLGRSQTAEPLPGYRVHPMDAIRWLTGELPLTSEGPDYSGRDQPLTLYSLHAHEVERWQERRGVNQRVLARAMDELRSAKTPRQQRAAQIEAEDARNELDGHHLKSLRYAMRQLGYLPPPLPSEVAQALGEEADDNGPR